MFVSATLLFLVQPMIAKMVLPLLGGTPAVWNTCMVFFQAALLAGYAYAHATTTRLAPRRQVLLHLGLILLPVALLVLPIGVKAGWLPPREANPIPWLLAILSISVGLPFVVLSATAPLLQKWFAKTGHSSADDPYFLYAASNLGSMLALFGYPTLVEPYLALNRSNWLSQSWLWTAGYVALALVMAVCGIVVWKSGSRASHDFKKDLEKPNGDVSQAEAPPGAWTKLRWIALAFVPSTMMLAVTAHISLNIAAIPLIWVVPLGLYLLSFIIVFAYWPGWLHKIAVFLLPLVLILFLYASYSKEFGDVALTIKQQIIMNLGLLFLTALVCHGELARTRPSPSYLTGFYLLMSLGGVLGGMFNALLAPMIFPGLWEYSLALVFTALVLPRIGAYKHVWISKFFEPDAALGVGVCVDVTFALVVGLASLGLMRFFHSPQFTRDYWTEQFQEKKKDGGGEFLTRPADTTSSSASIEQEYQTKVGSVTRGLIYVRKRANDGMDRVSDKVNELHAWWYRHAHPKQYAPIGSEGQVVDVSETPLPEGEKWEVPPLIGRRHVRGWIMLGIPLLLCWAFVNRPLRFGLAIGAFILAGEAASLMREQEKDSWSQQLATLDRERSFFGVLTVNRVAVEDSETDRKVYFRNLIHGTILHGMQCEDPARHREAFTYYHSSGPIGSIFRAFDRAFQATGQRKENYAFVGLGTGTLATFGSPGQNVTFYEIDPAIVRIAKTYFTNVQDCIDRVGQDHFKIVMGDARLRIEEAPDHSYDLLILDAFSSDAIPIHLLTREAIQLYLQKLKEDGILVLHISNRFLRLEPVCENLIEDLNLAGRVFSDDDESYLAKVMSTWVIVGRQEKYLDKITLELTRESYLDGLRAVDSQVDSVPGIAWHSFWPGPEQLVAAGVIAAMENNHSPWKKFAVEAPLRKKVGVWTDDYSNLLSIFQWKND
jgi:hypothetical protein